MTQIVYRPFGFRAISESAGVGNAENNDSVGPSLATRPTPIVSLRRSWTVVGTVPLRGTRGRSTDRAYGARLRANARNCAAGEKSG